MNLSPVRTQELTTKMRLRIHFFCIVMAVTVVGVLFNQALLLEQIDSLPIRSVLVLIGSYIFFFIAVRLWLSWQLSNQILIEKTADQDISVKKNRWWWSDVFSVGDAAQFAPFLFLFFFLCILAMWVFAEGPFILAEAAFEFAFFNGLINLAKHAHKNWYEHVFRQTIAVFSVLLIITFLVMLFAQADCPAEHRFYSIVKKCWMAKKS